MYGLECWTGIWLVYSWFKRLVQELVVRAGSNVYCSPGSGVYDGRSGVRSFHVCGDASACNGASACSEPYLSRTLRALSERIEEPGAHSHIL